MLPVILLACGSVETSYMISQYFPKEPGALHILNDLPGDHNALRWHQVGPSLSKVQKMGPNN